MPDDPFGNSRFAAEAEVSAHTDGDKANGVYLGYHFTEPDIAERQIRYAKDRHVLVFGPTGSGKGRRFLVPNLLLEFEDQSVIVIDPKGEAAQQTAEARRRMGHDVVILNPFNVHGLQSAGFNPLVRLDPESPSFFDDAAAIGDALIEEEGKEPHWAQSAQGLVVGLLMWERKRNPNAANACLANVRTMLTEAEELKPSKDAAGNISMTPVRGLRATASLMVERGGEIIASLAARFTGARDEVRSIISTADTQTRWLLSPLMRKDLQRNAFDFSGLRDRPTTVYVVLPAERLRTHAKWLRLVIVSALKSLYTSYKPGCRRVTLLVDEMAALGHLGALEDAFGLIRGYNIQIVAFLQDLGQLKNIYSERWETFIANAGAVFGFAPNDLTTARWMSDRSGIATIIAKSVSRNSGMTMGERATFNAGGGSSDQQLSRPLILPQELFGLKRGMALAWLAGLEYPVKIFAPDYEKIGACHERLVKRSNT